jgi:hypothetical protein
MNRLAVPTRIVRQWIKVFLLVQLQGVSPIYGYDGVENELPDLSAKEHS